MVRMPFPTGWLTVEQTAGELMVKPRTVVALVGQGKLRPRKYQRPGRGGAPISLFDPTEVETLRNQRMEAQMEVLPPGALMPAPRGAAVSIVHKIDAPAAARRKEADERRLVAFLNRRTPPRYLRFDESVLYTGLADKRLHELVDAGKIRTEQGPNNSKVLFIEDLDKL